MAGRRSTGGAGGSGTGSGSDADHSEEGGTDSDSDSGSGSDSSAVTMNTPTASAVLAGLPQPSPTPTPSARALGGQPLPRVMSNAAGPAGGGDGGDSDSVGPRASMVPKASRVHSLFPARTLGLLDHRTLQQRQAQRPMVGGGTADTAETPAEAGLTIASALAAKAHIGVAQRPKIGHQHDAAFVNERTEHDRLVTTLLQQENANIDLDLEAKRWAMATLREGWSTDAEEESEEEEEDDITTSGSDTTTSTARKRRRHRRKRRRKQRKAQELADMTGHPAAVGDGGAGAGAGAGAGGDDYAGGGSGSGSSSGSDSGSDSSGSGSGSSSGSDGGSTASTLSELTKAERQRLARAERMSNVPEVVRDRVEWSQRALGLKISSTQLRKLQELWGSLCSQGPANGASLTDLARALALDLDVLPLRKPMMGLVDEPAHARMGFKVCAVTVCLALGASWDPWACPCATGVCTTTTRVYIHTCTAHCVRCALSPKRVCHACIALLTVTMSCACVCVS